MGVRAGWIREGNTQRIFEMYKDGDGMGAHQIAGVFRDAGVSITVAYIREVIKNDAVMSSKGVPKKTVAKAIADFDGQTNPGFDSDGMLPVT